MAPLQAAEPAAKKLRVQEDLAATPQHLELPGTCSPAFMDAAETEAITVDYEEVTSRLEEVMAKMGVAIVRGVLGPEDAAELESALKEDLEELVDADAMDRADASVQTAWQRACQEGLQAWPAATLADVGARGRFQDRGLPHGRFAWRARVHPKVRRVYEVLHGTADLVSSCDNAFVANASQPMAQSNKNWPHVDQNDHDARIPSAEWNVYQGILYVWGSDTEHASTTVIWPGSHKVCYGDYMADPQVQTRIKRGSPHFTLISGMEPSVARDRLISGWHSHARRIPVPAGGLLLFTSRTTHQGWSGGPRLAQPVCWEPLSRRTALMHERKLRLAALGLPSTHWASLGLPHELSELSRPKPVEACAGTEHESVRFPLRASIRSQALVPSADEVEIWSRLQAPPWMEPLPPDLKALLDASISAEFRALL